MKNHSIDFDITDEDYEEYDYEKMEYKTEPDELVEENYENSNNAEIVKKIYNNLICCKLKTHNSDCFAFYTSFLISFLGVITFLVFSIIFAAPWYVFITLIVMILFLIFFIHNYADLLIPYTVYFYKIKGKNYIYLLRGQNDVTYYLNNKNIVRYKNGKEKYESTPECFNSRLGFNKMTGKLIRETTDKHIKIITKNKEHRLYLTNKFNPIYIQNEKLRYTFLEINNLDMCVYIPKGLKYLCESKDVELPPYNKNIIYI